VIYHRGTFAHFARLCRIRGVGATRLGHLASRMEMDADAGLVDALDDTLEALGPEIDQVSAYCLARGGA